MNDEGARPGRLRVALQGLIAAEPLRAASMVVTIYGDVVAPRGGVLWMGFLIGICAEIGISETLARTAVSRLVASGQIIGERQGRRSYYRMTDAAQAEFAGVALALFGPSTTGRNFLIAKENPDIDLVRRGFAPLSPGLMIGPEREGEAIAGLLFRAAPVDLGDEIRDFAASTWDLETHAEAWRAFIARYEPVAEAFSRARRREGVTCLMLRLILVHHYRGIFLRDPKLPDIALPKAWPGHEARRLFLRLYTQLSGAADSYIGENLVDENGPLPAVTEVTERRLAMVEEAFSEVQALDG